MLNEIQLKIKMIKSIASDPEEAHIEEDKLYHWFVKYVSENGPPELMEMAKCVLEVKDIEFERWYE